MTIQRTRELLQEEVNNMSDEQIEQLIAQYSKLADVVIDLMKHKPDNIISIVKRQRIHE